ncbi:3-hydroxyadipyl-CoA dehydrogenase [compost metagenome]
MSSQPITCVGIVGAGAMGQGIAQLTAQAGLRACLFDVRPGAARSARDGIAAILAKRVEKGRLTAEAADRAVGNLQVLESLEALRGCQVVVEAIVENLEAKQALFRQLEEVLEAGTILASNTSSLSITAIASACRDPGRVAGLHFFNPVPLMRLVEVIEGLATHGEVGERLCELVGVMGHQPVRARDTPGFIVNHAGRAFGTEALRILGEGVAGVAAIDAVLRESAGFRMGPFELLDLIGLDVSLPVMESVYRQFYEEPRYRPHPLLRQMLAAGHLGRKSGQGFYSYDGEGAAPRATAQAAPACTALPPVWLGADDPLGRTRLLALLERLGAEVESGEHPSDAALCLLAPLGDDASHAAQRFAVDPARVVAVDTLTDLERHRCLMFNPLTRADMRHAAHALFARDGAGVTVIRDSTGFIVQRTLASIVNLACDIAQQGIASVADIDLAVRLGLGYPHGPLEWGDRLGAARLLRILERIHALTGDPRYRPSPWLRRRASLGISLSQPENPLPA